MWSCPASQAMLALDEKRLAAKADPVSLRQREQWHRKKLSKFPVMENLTVPHKQLPDTVGSTIHTLHENPHQTASPKKIRASSNH
jgi:hypothetical protein